MIRLLTSLLLTLQLALAPMAQALQSHAPARAGVDARTLGIGFGEGACDPAADARARAFLEKLAGAVHDLLPFEGSYGRMDYVAFLQANLDWAEAYAADGVRMLEDEAWAQGLLDAGVYGSMAEVLDASSEFSDLGEGLLALSARTVPGLSKQELKGRLGVNDCAIRWLCENEYLPLQKSRSPTSRKTEYVVKVCDFDRFESQYVTLRNLSRLTKISSQKLRSTLSRAQVEPIDSSGKEGRNIFRRCDVERALNTDLG